MVTWWRYYAICLMFVGFGALVLLMGQSGANLKYEENAKALLASGRTVTAHITQKWSGRDDQWVSYRYQVDGRSYDGLFDPGTMKFLQLKVGDPLTVTYLPSNPKIADYNPQRRIGSKSQLQAIGFGCIGFGILCSLGVLLFQVRRESYGTYTPPESGARTYRTIFLLWIFGIVFFAAGAILQVTMIQQLLSGVPMPVRTDGNLHLASHSEQVMWTFFPVPFWFIGLALLLYGKNYRVVTTDDHIAVFNGWGRKTEWAWGDVRSVKRVYNRNNYSYVLGNGEKTITVSSSVGAFDSLEQELRDHLGDLMGEPHRRGTF